MTIKTENNKTVTIPPRVIEGKELGGEVETLVSNGVTYVRAFHTENATFNIQGTPKDLK